MKIINNTLHLECTAQSYIRWPQDKALFSSKKPYLLHGSGSNMLLLDRVYCGQLVESSNTDFIIREEDNGYYVELGAALNWHSVVKRLLDLGIFGLENLALIPGTVGAAPIQNIGAYGAELADFCWAVNGVLLDSMTECSYNNQACQFGYRDSIFKNELKDRFLITRVTLKLSKNYQPNTRYGALSELNKPTAHDIFKRVCQIRSEKLPDPAKIGNAGSFFKNPLVSVEQLAQLQKVLPDVVYFPYDDGEVKLAAGYLIEQAGLKGYQMQQAGVHSKQALVLINIGAATGLDIACLAAYVQQVVENKFNVCLQPEVRFINKNGECDAVEYLHQLRASSFYKNRVGLNEA
ncbi:UDP-N-acetylmuramate dehydrogenase [Catenovulum sediminis]|uniref:UDP-N-acetylmuramate dehydrogenase n=1 Tax=Catenovulum sediminis TaxID=1740262 RepID=UPI00117D66E4|nr:UDP-N-acetylmuramate dehydrogenase [Catenovulum sediminis]